MVRPVFTGDEQKFCCLVSRAIDVDGSGAEARTLLLRSLSLFLTQRKIVFSQDALALFATLLTSVFSSTLPFTVVQKGYRQIFFTPCDALEDVTLCYSLFKQVKSVEIPLSLVKSFVRRLTSASADDRIGAQECILTLSVRYSPQLLRAIAAVLSPAPPHGTDIILECAASLLDQSAFYDADLWSQLEKVLSHLHLAPHLKTFHANLIVALKSLHEKDGDIAHRSRRFLLNNWPRLDPQRAVMFMHEATAICTHGPPIEPSVWQRLSWRASSIQWQLASEGLSFVQQTVRLMPDADYSILRFLLDEAAKGHWSPPIRERASEVLAMLPPVEPSVPKVLQINGWNRIRDTARTLYPKIDFTKGNVTRK
jgi:hypothetical protein